MLYLQAVGEQIKSKAAVEEAYNALAWAHHLGNQQAPTEAATVKLLLQGLQRELARPLFLSQEVRPTSCVMVLRWSSPELALSYAQSGH